MVSLVQVLAPVVLLVAATLAPGAHARIWVSATFSRAFSSSLRHPKGMAAIFFSQRCSLVYNIQYRALEGQAPSRALYLEEPRSHRGLPPAPCHGVLTARVPPIIAPIIASPRPPLFFKRRLCQDADGLQMNFTAVRTGPSGNQPRVAFDRSQCSLIVQPCTM